MNDDRPTLITVPTELERADVFWDLAALFITVIIVWQFWLADVSILWMLPLILLVAVWSLTGEPATDVPYVGAIANGLRSKLGLRRAHEWVLAFLHYFRLAVWPIWRTNCIASYRSNLQRISAWRAWLSAKTRCSVSAGSSWAYRIRWRSSARPEA